jgi:NitT/TauT family transport system substrate-binding protein
VVRFHLIRAANAAWRAALSATAGVRVAVLVVVLLVASTGAVAGCGESSAAPDRVVLQLNWFHEAEFAGYYVAQAKGFYEEQNLDVTIVEGGPSKPAREEVLSGAATFAVTSFAEQRDMTVKRQPAVAVMAAFQIPPLVIFSLAESGIREPADLSGKKVGTTTNYWKNILGQTLIAAGVDPAAVTTVDVEAGNLQALYDGTVDAWLGYAQDEPIQAEVSGHPVTDIFPADFGIGGYEGLLITLESTIEDQPELVRRFVQACYDGWRYAVEHQDEAAQILTTWAPSSSLEFQELAVRAVAPLVDTPQAPIGWIDSERWKQLMGAAFDSTNTGYTMQFSPANP